MTFRSYTVALTLLLGAGNTLAQTAVQVEVFKSPYCGCCGQWVEHLRGNGFEVQTHKVAELPADIQKLHIPENLESCHTAKIGGYVIIGHVPAADIRRLLKEEPKAVGLSVPGMPAGSPGMEGAKPVHYETLLVQADGTTQVFARH
ncbi:MAG: DUF411 domain-containing protein [Sterolibacterium sp.]